MSFVANAILAALVAAVLLSVGFSYYDSTHFEAALHPLSQSNELQWTDIKTAHTREIATPKIVIAGGSGALFGLRCEILTRELGAPCVNGALPRQPALDDVLAFDRSLLLPGDVVLMQLDDATYLAPTAPQPPVRSTRLFHIDLDYLLTSIAERLMASTGYSFFGAISSTPEGDRRGHTRANAAQFADARTRETFTLLAEHPAGTIADATKAQLAAFLTWASDSRILVVGILPPTYDDWTIPDAWLTSIRQPYVEAGVPFVVLPNQGRYARDCFWDSSLRLNEECQALHSRQLADALAPILKERGYAFR
jgi:hypothetical protein